MSMNSGAVTLVYDGDGNRVAKTASSGTTTYLVDDLNPTGLPQVVDEIVGGAVQRTYTYGLQRIGENQFVSNAWIPSFYEYDGEGSVRQLTSSAGSPTDTYEYDAFGNEVDHTGTTPNNYLYRGEQWDPDLGLYYLRARYMNPLTGRFLSRDPEDGDPASPASLHKYSYAEADPVNLVDPSGRAALAQTAQLTITVSVPAVITAVGATTAALLCDYIWEGSTTTAQTQAELTNGHVVTAAPYLSQAVPGAPTLPPPPIPFVWMWPNMPNPNGCPKGQDLHHMLPQQFKAWFNSRGIPDIDAPQYTKCVPRACHTGRGGLHSNQNGPGTHWNGRWRRFMREKVENPRRVTALTALRQADRTARWG